MLTFSLLCLLLSQSAHPGQVVRLEAYLIVGEQVYNSPVYTTTRFVDYTDKQTGATRRWTCRSLDGQACVVLQYCGTEPVAVEGRWTDVSDIVLLGARLLRVDRQSAVVEQVSYEQYIAQRREERGY